LLRRRPPPVVAIDKYRELRFNTAVEAFEDLCPGNAYEGRLAVQIGLTGAHAAEIMREASLHRNDFAKLCRCRAQAASAMRAGASAKRSLEQEQKMRRATEAVAGTAPAQAAEAATQPPSAVTPAAAPPLPPVVMQLRSVAPPAALPLAMVGSAPPPSPEAIEQAEIFAADNVEVAVRIRHDRGVTRQCRKQFRDVTLPSDPAVIDALVRGISPLLTRMDDFGGRELDAAD
jgi:hypothetical protein